ncbi:MAG: PAS domain S-box protein, partial [Verrucomicrobia bacterium]
FHPEHPRRRFLEAMERDGEVRGLESAWRRADGSYLYVRESAKAVRDESGRILYFDGVAEDITEQRQAKEALAESERKYRELVQNAASIILRMDRHGAITFINEFGLQFFGFSEEELLGRNVMDTIVPQEESTGRKLKPMIEDICRHPEKYANNINENICKDGRRVWIAWTNRAVLDEKGQLKEIFCVGTDITARRQAEEALARERTLLRTLLDLLPVAVYAKDLQGRKILANKVEARLMGFESVEEVLGKTDHDVYPKEVADDFVRDDQRVLLKGEQILNREQPLRSPDGTMRWFFVSKVPLRDEWGRISGLVGVSVDVTEEREAREQLRAALEEKTALLREVHHRVKNNLQTVCSLVHLQKEQTADPAIAALLESTERRVRSMAMLHEAIYQSASVARVPAAAYLRRLCDYLASVADPAVARRVRLLARVAEAEFPPQTALPLGLLVSELVANAYKHAFPDQRKGVIKVHLEELPAASGTLPGPPPTSRTFELVVQDDGAGLPDLEAALQGGSLGLQLVRSLARQLGGTLTHEGPPGTTFRIRFETPMN